MDVGLEITLLQLILSIEPSMHGWVEIKDRELKTIHIATEYIQDLSQYPSELLERHIEFLYADWYRRTLVVIMM